MKSPWKTECHDCEFARHLRQSHLFGVRAKRTFDDAAAKYLLDHQDKVSIESDIYHLERLMPYIGQYTLDQIHDGTLEAFVRDRKAQGLSNKTINLGLTLVGRMLLSSRQFRRQERLGNPRGIRAFSFPSYRFLSKLDTAATDPVAGCAWAQ